jgi:cell division protein ZapA
MPARRSIAVRILGHEYRIKSDSDEAQVERVARYVDDTMTRIRERTKTVDSLDLAILAALNLANDLLARREGSETPWAGAASFEPERLQGLIHLAESALAEEAEAG